MATSREMGHQGFSQEEGDEPGNDDDDRAGGIHGCRPHPARRPDNGIGVTPAVPQGSSFKKIERGSPSP